MMSLLTGDLLIIISQIISATQFVYEEKFIKKHNFHPLLVVGLEGLKALFVHLSSSNSNVFQFFGDDSCGKIEKNVSFGAPPTHGGVEKLPG